MSVKASTIYLWNTCIAWTTLLENVKLMMKKKTILIFHWDLKCYKNHLKCKECIKNELYSIILISTKLI